MPILICVEVLAPVGSKDALKAAILGEADAVYLGGRQFGARRLAENFTIPELKGAVNLAHKHGVKVYVTVNTLVKERELQPVFSYLRYLSDIRVDAVIVQDKGLLKLIRENFSIPIHASTQMGIHSPFGAIWAEKNGISRIILARELHIDALKKIREATHIGLEVFVHGALCYSFSGQCLFSSILGGRSGNRGLCAQPCRKPYTIGDKTAYWLSTADIFSIDALPDLLKIGIDGVKIEGRLRSPVYVYLTSKIYSNAIKRAENGEETLITPREKEMLEVVFNRGFTKGYLTHSNVMQREYPQSRGLPIGEARSDGKEIAVKADNLKLGDGVTLYKGKEKIGGFRVGGGKMEKDYLVLRPPFKVSSGQYRLYKTKDREFDSIQQMIESFEMPTIEGKMKNHHFDIPNRKRGRRKGELSIYVSSLKALESVLPYADRIYFEFNNHIYEALTMCKKKGTECVLMLPRLSFDMPDLDVESMMINSVDQFEKYADKKLYGHYSMNFFNSLTMPELFQYTLSVELSRDDICEIASHYSGRLETLVFGRIELMVTREPSLNEGMLIDQKRKRFPFYRDQFSYVHILNSSDLFLLDFLDELEGVGIDSLGIDLRRRDRELCETVAKTFYERDLTKKQGIKKKCGSITSGHYLRGVD